LLDDDNAPNPSEAVLAALGSCLSVGMYANAVYRNVRLTKVELELEGDINITAVWGTGDTSDDKIVGPHLALIGERGVIIRDLS
jgi:hypothetical protein